MAGSPAAAAASSVPRGFKTAVVAMCFNDWAKLDAWVSHTREYIDEVDLHIVVSAGPEPPFSAALRAAFPASVILELEGNVGPCVAYNRGIQYALDHGAECIALIGNDVRMEAHAVRLLFSCVRHTPEVGLAGPVLLKGGAAPDVVEWAGGRIGWLRMSTRFLSAGATPESLPPGLIDVDFVPGGCNFARADIYRRVGLQDERLFMYGDEMDFDVRVTRAGYRVVVLGGARAWHEHVETRPPDPVETSGPRSAWVLWLMRIGNVHADRRTPAWIVYLVNRNRILLARWHKSPLGFLVFAAVFLAQVPLSWVIWRASHGVKEAHAVLRAAFDGFRGVGGRPSELGG